MVKMLNRKFIRDSNKIFSPFSCGQIFQQSVGIPLDTNCALLLADLFLYLYEAEFNKDFNMGRKKLFFWPSIPYFHKSTMFLSSTCNQFHSYIDSIYPKKLEIKDTTKCSISVISLELNTNGKIKAQLYDKRDYFNFPIVNFPYHYSNIQISPAYSMYISQLI
jgi:hypothetical protein